MSLKHIDEDFINKVCGRIWQVRHAVMGLGTLMEVDRGEVENKRLTEVGIGQTLKILSKELETAEELLYHGERN